MEKHTVVVGGGISGLTAAAYVSKDNKPVTLFEKQEKVGGLVQSFTKNGFLFDTGLRSIENSGIVIPMLKELEIDLDFIKCQVSMGLGRHVIKLSEDNNLPAYSAFLKREFPGEESCIDSIILEITKITNYMNILYGIDNPVFKNIRKDPVYLRKVFLPWLVKYVFTIKKILKIEEPVYVFLRHITQNIELIDIIAQHFFKKTPAFFALSYFSLYQDYYYPRGGTGEFSESLSEYVINHGGNINLSTSIVSVNPEQKYVVDDKGKTTYYKSLIWAADLKLLYKAIETEKLKNKKIIEIVNTKKKEIKDLHGGESVLTVYLCVDENKEYFREICSEHFFYTPLRIGISSIDAYPIDLMIKNKVTDPSPEAKGNLKNYLRKFVQRNTFEISIPVLRDDNLAPKGQTGLIVSLLFDYALVELIEQQGWIEEFKTFMENLYIESLENSIFPGLGKKIINQFSSTPLTIKKQIGSTDGAITGWAFTNSHIPVISKLTKMFDSVITPLPSIYQAGQWSYSPSGFPISVLTGKLSACKALSKKKF